MRIAISQSMLFPWIGLLEQVRLADTFVHYDDVQFSKGSFVNRVQIKTAAGMRWMSVPLRNHHFGQRIDEIEIMPITKWRDTHLDLLTKSFGNAPYASEALQIAERVYAVDHPNLGALARSSFRALTQYFGLDLSTRFVDIKDLNIDGTSSTRVLATVRRLCGTTYITGHGAARYLDHALFEETGVEVEYMKYRCLPYLQSHGPFTPYVSSLDLVAHCGKAGITYICSDTVSWREFTNESE